MIDERLGVASILIHFTRGVAVAQYDDVEPVRRVAAVNDGGIRLGPYGLRYKGADEKDKGAHNNGLSIVHNSALFSRLREASVDGNRVDQFQDSSGVCLPEFI